MTELNRRSFLKRVGVASFGAMSLIGGCVEGLTSSRVKKKPNIVFILADDMGIDSVSELNAKSGIETPYINKMISEGMSFSDAHSGSAVCTPTRYGVLTGRYAWRTRLKAGIVGHEESLIAEDRLTVGGMLQEKGYHTACIGKWHLGMMWRDKDGNGTTRWKDVDYSKPIIGSPVTRGFDHYFGDDVINKPPYAWIENDKTVQTPTEEMTGGLVGKGPKAKDYELDEVLPTLTQKCVDHIGKRAKTDKPFFLYFALNSPHGPIVPSKNFRGKSGVSPYADFLIETDHSVGQVLKALEDNGIADNTLVIFTTDNGTSDICDFEGLEDKGVFIRENWRGHKADIWEGGHRVPFVAKWLGVIKAGSECDEIVSLVDFMATAAEIVGYDYPDSAAEDSVSMLSLLKGKRIDKSLRDAIVCHTYRGYFAIRRGKWKVNFCPGSGGWSHPTNTHDKIKSRKDDIRKVAFDLGLPPVQLYDLDADPKEQNNLCKKYPEKVEELRQLLKRYVDQGRSTPGEHQKNDGPEHWQQLPF